MNEKFRLFAERAAWVTGTSWAFFAAVALIVGWLLTGPMFGFSDTWQLVINTGTTIITFLMVFLIQNSQNRDARAMQLKLDELIRSTAAARDSLIDLEHLSDAELTSLQEAFQRLKQRHGDRVEPYLDDVEDELEERGR